MSLHQTNKDKPRAQKCCHFCFSFDLHNYCPTCREAGKGDDPCVKNRKRYLKKQKAESCSKDNELDLLGEGDGDSFTGSNADLESAADNLFTHTHTQPLQGRISPLQPDTGLLSPLGLSPQGLFLIKTFHNMIQTPLIIGK